MTSTRTPHFDLPRSYQLLAMIALLIASPHALFADATHGGSNDESVETEEARRVAIDQWWLVSPRAVTMPLFGDDYGASDVLEEEPLDVGTVVPGKDQALAWPATYTSGEKPYAWQSRTMRSVDLEVDLGDVGLREDQPLATAWLATYVSVDRFTPVTLKVTTGHALEVYLDGEELEERDAGKDEPLEVDLALERGSHVLIIRSVYVRDEAPGSPAWTLSADLELAKESRDSEVTVSLEAPRDLRLSDLLDASRVRDIDVSPDGRWVAIQRAETSTPKEGAESWIDIVELPSGDIVQTLRAGASHFAWSSSAETGRFAYVAANDLWVGSVSSGALQQVLQDVEKISGVRFAGEQLLVALDESPEADERDVKRYRDLADRWSYRRDLNHLYLVAMNGARQRISDGVTGAQLLDVSPEGDRMVLSRTFQDHLERPYSRSEVYEVDLETLVARSLFESSWISSALYSPSGRQLMVLAGPVAFDTAVQSSEESGDIAIANDVILNDYDTEAFLWDLDKEAAVELTGDFDPSVLAARWSADGDGYLRVQNGSLIELVRLDVGSTSAPEVLPTGVDAVQAFDVGGTNIVYVGSSPSQPPTLWMTDSKAQEPRRLLDPSDDAFEGLRFGEVHDWSFTSERGDEIAGRYYLPTGFDETASYPLIVYYYGGTTPVSKTFGGRYPKEWWAAQGYVVYVVQPSGAIGYGQEFSSRHVGAWGRLTADEIIEGTKRFIEVHDFVDRQKIGAIGASYGGFMTMYLQTRTDLFAAAVSHAGISNLASYWGQGWWGYAYSSVASAESFPWNDRELYVEQSPLYHADKITTPLLLLHGNADTNVPPVESHQMYTALKLLDRPVELIEIGGEDHHILSYDKRMLWSKTIVAWFDRYLKGQPAAWEHLWGTDDDPKG